MEDSEILKQFGYSSSMEFSNDFMKPENLNIKFNPNLRIRKSKELQTNGLFFEIAKDENTKQDSCDKYFDEEKTLLELIRVPSENILNMFTLGAIFKSQEKYDNENFQLLEDCIEKINKTNNLKLPVCRCKEVYNTFMTMFDVSDLENGEKQSLFEIDDKTILFMCLNALFFWNSYKSEILLRLGNTSVKYFNDSPIEKFSPYVKLLNNSEISNNFLKNSKDYGSILTGTTLSFLIPKIHKEHEKYNLILSAFSKQYKGYEDVLKSKLITLQTYLNVLVILESRSLELPMVELTLSSVQPDNYVLYSSTLLPLVDFANHDMEKLNSHFDADPTTGDAVLVLDLSLVENELQQEKGSFEIFIRYTDDDTDILPFMCQYGFIPNSSSWKIYPFQLKLYFDNDEKLFSMVNVLFTGDCTILQISVTGDQENVKLTTIQCIQLLYDSLPVLVRREINKINREDDQKLSDVEYLQILKQYMLQYCIPKNTALIQQKLKDFLNQPKEDKNNSVNFFLNFEQKLNSNLRAFMSNPDTLIEDIFGFYD